MKCITDAVGCNWKLLGFSHVS